jgi:hypothetical protein
MLTLIFLTLLYFLPTLIASHRGHSTGGILILNFLLGWTGIGWLALMVWALASTPPLYFVMRPTVPPHMEWRRY